MLRSWTFNQKCHIPLPVVKLTDRKKNFPFQQASSLQVMQQHSILAVKIPFGFGHRRQNQLGHIPQITVRWDNPCICTVPQLTACSTFWDTSRGNLAAQNAKKTFGGRGSASDPAGELPALSQTLSWWEGLATSRSRASSFGPLCLVSCLPTPKLVPTPLGLGLASCAPSTQCPSLDSGWWRPSVHTYTSWSR